MQAILSSDGLIYVIQLKIKEEYHNMYCNRMKLENSVCLVNLVGCHDGAPACPLDNHVGGGGGGGEGGVPSAPCFLRL